MSWKSISYSTQFDISQHPPHVHIYTSQFPTMATLNELSWESIFNSTQFDISQHPPTTNLPHSTDASSAGSSNPGVLPLSHQGHIVKLLFSTFLMNNECVGLLSQSALLHVPSFLGTLSYLLHHHSRMILGRAGFLLLRSFVQKITLAQRISPFQASKTMQSCGHTRSPFQASYLVPMVSCPPLPPSCPSTTASTCWWSWWSRWQRWRKANIKITKIRNLWKSPDWGCTQVAALPLKACHRLTIRAGNKNAFFRPVKMLVKIGWEIGTFF